MQGLEHGTLQESPTPIQLDAARWLPVALAFMICAAVLWKGLTHVAAALTGRHDSPSGIAESSDLVPPRREQGPLSAIFTPQVQFWSPEIHSWAEAWQLDPNLVGTVMQIESCGHPGVRSNAGAIGLFQVMPFHFEAAENPEDPQVNARRGLAYLAQSLSLAEGDVGRALAGYNGGHGLIDRPINEWPEETKRYVYWGSGIYLDALSGAMTSPQLERWLSAGGSYLCGLSLAALSSDG